MPAASAPPTYRDRLRLEGATLAAIGIAASVALVAGVDGATDGPGSTIGQLLVVVVLLAILGPRSVRSALAGAEPLTGPEVAGSGEPTPLWHLPLVVAVLSVPLLLVDVPDAALRVTGGCALVGVAQAALLAGLVSREEMRTGRAYVRRPGSRILRGTKLGWWPQVGATAPATRVGARP